MARLLWLVWLVGPLFWLCVFLLWFLHSASADTLTLTIDQAADCPNVASWDVFLAPITTANPNPVFPGGTPVSTITNAAPIVCGAGVKLTAVTNCLGNTRGWVRATSNTAPVVVSAPSNSLDFNCPLTPPTLRAVQP